MSFFLGNSEMAGIHRLFKAVVYQRFPCTALYFLADYFTLFFITVFFSNPHVPDHFYRSGLSRHLTSSPRLNRTHTSLLPLPLFLSPLCIARPPSFSLFFLFFKALIFQNFYEIFTICGQTSFLGNLEEGV